MLEIGISVDVRYRIGSEGHSEYFNGRDRSLLALCRVVWLALKHEIPRDCGMPSVMGRKETAYAGAYLWGKYV